MIQDNNLFKYNLAIASVFQNEAPYMKEWIEYHLLTGVDHFYVYDNESQDDLKEVLQPYIDKGIVDYKYLPGQRTMMVAYNDAFWRHKFECKYISFLDADEFLYPKNNESVIEVVDDILSKDEQASGLAIYWQCFGSAGQEKADFSRGVLERFLLRSATNNCTKLVVNPRGLDIMENPHYGYYYDGRYSVDEDGKINFGGIESILPKRIAINHYLVKSKEEYFGKTQRKDAFFLKNSHTMEAFEAANKVSNEVYDDSILHYKEKRFKLLGEFDQESTEAMNQRRLNALVKILSPLILPANLPIAALNEDSKNLFKNNMDLFLTCFFVARDLKNKILSEVDANIFEELSLKCINKLLQLQQDVKIWELQLLIDELPRILNLKYHVVEEIKYSLKLILPHLMYFLQVNNNWRKFKELDGLVKSLNTI